MGKLIGYLFTLIGIILIAFPVFKKNINQNILLYSGIILIILGIIFYKAGNQERKKEVPIYDKTGKNIIGYRKI